jgi:hypothetical protein
MPDKCTKQIALELLEILNRSTDETTSSFFLNPLKKIFNLEKIRQNTEGPLPPIFKRYVGK